MNFTPAFSAGILTGNYEDDFEDVGESYISARNEYSENFDDFSSSASEIDSEISSSEEAQSVDEVCTEEVESGWVTAHTLILIRLAWSLFSALPLIVDWCLVIILQPEVKVGPPNPILSHTLVDQPTKHP